jgi:hypothetical protein
MLRARMVNRGLGIADWGHTPSPAYQIASKPRVALYSPEARFAGPGLNAATAFAVQELPGPRNWRPATQQSQPRQLLHFLSGQASPLITHSADAERSPVQFER